MEIKKASFVCSNTKISALPEAVIPEYAFIGRSNVGKSSLINMLVQHKGLAKTSQKPGKTQLINHFIVNEQWYLVDLPGYGYAKTSKTNRATWSKFIKNYLLKRENLQCVFVLIDSRIPPQQIDLDFCNWLGEHGIAFLIAFTKSDKQSTIKTQQSVSLFQAELLKNFEDLPRCFITSSEKRVGRDEILDCIHSINLQFEVPDLSHLKDVQHFQN